MTYPAPHYGPWGRELPAPRRRESRYHAAFYRGHRPRISLPWQPCRTPEGFDCVALLLGSSAVLLRSQPRGFSVRTRHSVAEASGGLSRTSSFHQHPHQVAFLHDHVLDAVELDFGAGPLAEQHPVADLDVDRDELATLIATTRADGNDLPFLRFFLRGIRDDDAAAGLLFSFDPLDDDAIVKWTEFHCCPPK